MIRHTLRTLAVIALLALALPLAPGARVEAAPPTGRIDNSVDVLREMVQQADSETMAKLLKKAKGVAIFPSVIKAGLMVGGRYGEGLVLRHDPRTGSWYGPNFVTIKGVSYGPQIGFQSTALVLVITNDQGMKRFQGDKVTLGGDVSVAAGPVGRHAEASTDADLKASIYSYSMSKGIFAGLSLEGAVIAPDDAANQEYWKTALRPDEALNRRATAAVTSLLQELQRLVARAR